MWNPFKRAPKPEPKVEVQGPPSPPAPVEPPKPTFRPADQREADLLNKLYPPFKARVEAVLLQARSEGLPVYIFEGERTWQRQEELYAKGRDKNGVVVDKKAVVTKAKPGSSFHNYALAVDIVFDGDTNKPGVQWSWAAPDSKWKRLGAIGQACGLDWAGSWVTFQEFPHFQVKTSLKASQLKEAYLAGGLKKVWELVGATI